MIKKFIWYFVMIFVSFSLQICQANPHNSVKRDMLIGDSHAGGLKPYLQKRMSVRYKNGTTAAYWLRQSPVYGLNKLYILTGTNEQFNGTSPSVWMRQVNSICAKWNPRSCVVVSPPPNRKRNYKAYWNAINRPVVWLTSGQMAKDGVHYTGNTYKNWSRRF